eukprot:1155212-Pelagomonas_calceolata.AAC.1
MNVPPFLAGGPHGPAGGAAFVPPHVGPPPPFGPPLPVRGFFKVVDTLRAQERKGMGYKAVPACRGQHS